MRLSPLLSVLLLPLFAAPLAAQTHSWTNGVGGNWDLGSNWSTGTVPNGPGDSPGITLTGPGPYTVTMNLDVTMNDFNFAPSNGTLLVSGRTVTMNGSGSLAPAAASLLQMRSSTWTGTGTLTNQSTIEARGASRFERLMNIGTLNSLGSATNGTGSLTLDNIVVNSGDIFIDSIDGGFSSNLIISPGGRLDNTGNLEFRTGSGGARTFTGALRNTNTVTFGESVSINTGPLELFGGTFTITPTHVLTLNSGIDVNLQSGVLQIDGQLIHNSGAFTMTGGDMFGMANLRSGSLDLNAAGTALFQMEGSTTLTGNAAAAQELRVRGSAAAGTGSMTIPNDINNDGIMSMSSQDGGFSSSISMGSGMTFTNRNAFTVGEGTGGARTFTGALLNQGSLTMERSTSMNTGPFTNQGTWTIQPSATMTMNSGIDFVQESGTLAVDGQLIHNSGTNSYIGGSITGTPEFRSGSHIFDPAFSTAFTPIWAGSATLLSDIPAATTVRMLGQPATGNGVLNSASDRTLSGALQMESEGGGFSASWAGSGTTLTNQGTLSILIGAGGPRTFTGSLDNQSTVDVFANTTFNTGVLNNDGSWTVDSSSTMTINGAQGFTQSGGTLAVDGAIIQNSGPANFFGGTVTGTPSLRNIALSLGPAFNTAATFELRGSGQLLTDAPATTDLTLLGTASNGTQTLTLPGDTTMAGTTALTSVDGGFASNLTVNGGFTLTQSGTMRVEPGAGGPRTLTGTIRNTGTMEYDANTTHNSGTFTNEGNLTVLSGRTLTINSSVGFVQQSGNLDNQGTFFHSGGTNDFFGGTIAGILNLRSSTVNFDAGFTSPVELKLEGSTTFTGAVVSDQILNLFGSPAGGTQTFTTSAGLETAGRIIVTNEGGGFASNITVTGGPLHNTGQMRVEKAFGGPRTINAQFDNEGVLSVLDTSATFSGSGLNNMQGGTVRGDGTFIVTSSGGVQNNGHIQPGEGIGSMAITGDLHQGADGILSIQLGGNTPDTEYDVLHVSGNANLDGEVHLRLENGFIPAYGDQFTVLNAGAINGEFTNVRIRGGQLALGLGFDLVHTATTVIAQVVRVINLPPGGGQPTPVLIDDPVPSIPGQNNVFQINNVTGGSLVELVFGLSLGTTVIGGCPDDYGIASAQVLGTAVASSSGIAMMTVVIPGGAAGTTGYFQAFDMVSCRLSDVKAIVFN